MHEILPLEQLLAGIDCQIRPTTRDCTDGFEQLDWQNSCWCRDYVLWLMFVEGMLGELVEHAEVCVTQAHTDGIEHLMQPASDVQSIVLEDAGGVPWRHLFCYMECRNCCLHAMNFLERRPV